MLGELTEVAILAYRTGRYSDAIELLTQVTEHDRKNWFAVLYLGMAFEKVDRLTESHAQFKRIVDECTEPQICQKAQFALPLLEAQLQRRFCNEADKGNTGTSTQIACAG